MANDRTLILNYNTLSPFTFNSALIESDGANALLKKINDAALEFQQAFSSSVGFTYDVDLAEFVEGKLQQKCKQAADILFVGLYKNDGSADLCYALGSKTATTRGSVTVANGVAVLNSGSIEYSGVDNTSLQKGTIYVEITPGYSGNPSKVQHYYMECKANGQVNNGIDLYHNTNGAVYLWVRNSSGTTVFQASIGSLSPVQGTKIKWKINYDFTEGDTQVYKDGSPFGSNFSQTFTRDVIGIVRIGDDQTATSDGLFTFDNLVRYSEVQAGGSDPDFETFSFKESKVDLPQFSYTDIGSIQAWESLAATLTNAPRLIHAGLWYSGGTWIASDGTYAQANTLAEAQAGIATHPLSNNIIPSIVFGQSDDRQSIDLYRLFYTGQKYSIATPWIMVTEGTYLDGIGTFTVASTLPANTSLKFTININGVDYWFDTTWKVSNGTPAEGNTLAELNTNIGSFVFGLGKLFKLKVFLITTDDQATPLLFKVTMTYDFNASPSYPDVCRMYGWVVDNSGNPVAGAVINFDSADFYSGDNAVTKGVSTTSDDAGFYDKDLVIAGLIEQTIKYTNNDGSAEEKFDKILVPDLESAAVAEHLSS